MIEGVSNIERGISLSRIGLIASSLAYVALLNLTYIKVLVPLAESTGYAYHSPSLISIVFASLMAVAPSFWMPVALKRPSQVVYWLLYVLVLIPTSIVALYKLGDEPSRLLSLGFSLLVAFALLGSIYRLPLLRLPRVQLPRFLFWSIIALLSVVFYVVIVSVFGIQFNIVSLAEVYKLRSEYTQTLLTSGSFVVYAVTWQANVLNVLLIGRGLVSRDPVLLLVGILGQLMIFSITGFKSVLFSAVLILALLLALRSEGKNLGLTISWGMVGLVLVTATIPVTFFSVMLLNRVIMTPGLLTVDYFEFFSENPNALLGHGILKFFVSYPYDLAPPDLIGKFYLQDPTASANANLWADAYANFGYGGVFVFTSLLGLMLWIYDSAAKGRDYQLTSLMAGVPAFALANTALLTWLLTQGFGLTLLVIYLMPKAKVTTSNKSGRTREGSRLADGSKAT